MLIQPMDDYFGLSHTVKQSVGWNNIMQHKSALNFFVQCLYNSSRTLLKIVIMGIILWSFDPPSLAFAIDADKLDAIEKLIGEIEESAKKSHPSLEDIAKINTAKNRLAIIADSQVLDLTTKAQELTAHLTVFDGDENPHSDAIIDILLPLHKKLGSQLEKSQSKSVDYFEALNMQYAAMITNINDNTALQSKNEINNAIKTLVDQLFKIQRTYFASDAFANLADATKILVNDEANYRARLLDVSVQQSLSEVSNLIDTKLVTVPETLFTNKANQLTSLIFTAASSTDAIKEQIALNRKRIITAPAAMAARDALIKALTDLNDSLGKRIHIESAMYGDMGKGASSKRRCDATKAIRTECQGKNSCSVTTELKSAVNLCGFDPIPLAENKTKKLAIGYFCIETDKAGWDSLALYPDRDPGTAQSRNASASLPKLNKHNRFFRRKVFFSQGSWEFRCEANEAVLYEAVTK